VFASTDTSGPVAVAFTDRHGGVSPAPFDSLNLGAAVGDDAEAVSRNFALVGAAVNVAPQRIVRMRQVHGTDVVFVRGPAEATQPADGLITNVAGVVLCVRAADCVPVLLADTAHRVVGCAHAGRQGMAVGIIAETVARMRGHGATEITAWLGPHICAACYEVPAALRAEVAALVPESYAQTSWGTPSVDLGAGVRSQLVKAGCAVVDRSRCTAECQDLYSYRRDGRRSGRMAGLIWIRP
jgi:YfiH family protein